MERTGRVLVFAAAVLGTFGQESQRFDKRSIGALFPNVMARLSRADVGLIGALHDFETGIPYGCRFLTAVRGRFTSSIATEAIVSADCGESHAENWGSTLFAELRDGTWIVRWRQSGLITNHCTRIEFAGGRRVIHDRPGSTDHLALLARRRAHCRAGRWEVVWHDPTLNIFHCGGLRLGNGIDFLMCGDRSREEGIRRKHLFTIDLSKPQGQRRQVFLTIEDTLLTRNAVGVHCNLEGGEVTNVLVVKVRRGVVRRDPATIPLSARERKEPFFIDTELVQLRFRFDGTGFAPDADSAFVLEEWQKDR